MLLCGGMTCARPRPIDGQPTAEQVEMVMAGAGGERVQTQLLFTLMGGMWSNTVGLICKGVDQHPGRDRRLLRRLLARGGVDVLHIPQPVGLRLVYLRSRTACRDYVRAWPSAGQGVLGETAECRARCELGSSCHWLCAV